MAITAMPVIEERNRPTRINFIRYTPIAIQVTAVAAGSHL